MESSDLNASFTKLKIIKNLVIISISFLLIFTAYDGLGMLQTTMNKEEAVGTVAQAILHSTYGISSLLLSSFIVKKLGTKNTQLLGMTLYLPYVAANFYPSWITLVPSGLIIGIGVTLLWGAQCTYFNECSVLYKILTDASSHNNQRPKVACIYINEGTETLSALEFPGKAVGSQSLQGTFRYIKECTGELSALEFQSKTNRNQNNQCDNFLENSSSVSLPPERYAGSPELRIPAETNLRNKDTTEYAQGFGNVRLKSPETTDVHIKEDGDSTLHTTRHVRNKQNQKSNSLSSVNALFFGFHGLAYCSAQVWSNLISFYVLNSGRVENYNKTSNCSCGAHFCNTDQECVDSKIEEVPEDVRLYYTGVCFACGILAVLLIWLFVDHMEKSKGPVTLSWTHIFATIKFSKNKEQFFIIPMSIITSMIQAFFMADFTKSYIACSWSTSHVGLVSVFYGATSALSSIISGVLIRLFGRRIVLIFCQKACIVSLALLYLWIPDAQKPFMLYLAGGIYGFIVGIFHSQLKALYGVFFQGDEETAFSSCNMYSSIGWALPFFLSEFFCTSVKICIMFTIACLGLIGYLLAERSFSQRKKRTESVK